MYDSSGGAIFNDEQNSFEASGHYHDGGACPCDSNYYYINQKSATTKDVLELKLCITQAPKLVNLMTTQVLLLWILFKILTVFDLNK